MSAHALADRLGERAVLGRLIEEVRAGQGRALVVRGDPGVGKTVLLDYLAGRARACRVARARCRENIDRSVMMVTALSPVIGYNKAAEISSYAIDHDLTLKQAALAKGVSEELFDRVVIPLALTRPGSADIPSGAQKP